MTTIFDCEYIEKLGRKKKLRLINSLNGAKQASLIGTTNSKKKTNLALFNSIIHLSSDPALIGLTLRPTTVPRHTYHCLLYTSDAADE